VTCNLQDDCLRDQDQLWRQCLFVSVALYLLHAFRCFFCISSFAAGTRFRYPSSFVLVPGDLDVELTRIHASLFQHQVSDVDASSQSRTTNVVDSALLKLASTVRLDCSFGDKWAARRTIGKVWQDGMVSSGLFLHGYVCPALHLSLLSFFHSLKLSSVMSGANLFNKSDPDS